MDAKQFLAEFKHIVSAPEGMKRLRELIFNLAITGNLTQQLAAEGDGLSLLREINRAKAQLISERLFKSTPQLESKPLLIPTNIRIPNSWCWARLVDIGEINPKNKAAPNTLASFVPMSSVPQLYSGALEFEQRVWRSINRGFTHFADGDVVIAKITPSFENGKSAVIRGLINGIGAGTTELHVVRPVSPFIEPAYIHIFLCSPHFKVEGERNMRGLAGQKRLPTEYFATHALPLPPIEEQRRIVTKVNELIALCDKLEAQQQERESLGEITRTAVLDSVTTAQNSIALSSGWTRVRSNIRLWLENEDAVTELRNAVAFLGCRGLLTEIVAIDSLELRETDFALPPGWSWTTLRQLSDYITSGSRSWSQFIAPQGDIFIRSQDIKQDFLVFENTAFVNLPEKVEGQRTLVRPGDLLITITGANVGKCAQVPLLSQKAYVSQHVALVRVKDVQHTPFLHWWITNAFGGQKYLSRFIYGDKPGLNLSQVGSIPIPFPPQDVQSRIVEALVHYRNLCDRLSASIRDSRTAARILATTAVSSVTGIRIQEQEKMKVPKTELVSNLRIGINPPDTGQARLAAILTRNNDELPAKTLWDMSGLEIDAFYQQLKIEMAEGWIVQSEVAYVQEVGAS